MTQKPAAKPKPVYSTRADAEGHTVLRDGEPLQTPANRAVTMPTAAVAQAIAEECSAQGDKLDLRRMPLTQLALTAIDITALQRDNVIDGILRYGESELICHRAPEPEGLAAAQAAVWQPYLDWAADALQAPLNITTGLTAIAQPETSVAHIRAAVEGYDAFALTGVSEAVGMTGSLILGLAAMREFRPCEDIVAAVDCDRSWQEQKWGADAENVSRRAALLDELTTCLRWLHLLRA